MSLLLSRIHQETDSGVLATGYTSEIQTYLAGDSFASGYYKNHIGREFNRKLANFGLTGYIYDPVDPGYRPTTLTGILAA